MNIHRAGGTIKRGRGRPKGSKSKKPATESAVLNTDSTNQPGLVPTFKSAVAVIHCRTIR